MSCIVDADAQMDTHRFKRDGFSLSVKNIVFASGGLLVETNILRAWGLGSNAGTFESVHGNCR